MRIRTSGYWTDGLDVSTGPSVIEVDAGVISSIVPETRSEVDVATRFFAVPGLIDCHEHLGINAGEGDAEHTSDHLQSIEPIVKHAIKSVATMRKLLDHGVTAIRECGERPDAGRFLIDAQRKGVIAGPRIFRSLRPISRTGGHAWYLSHEADGVDQVIKAVRQNVKDGCDFIKVMITGGIGTAGSDTTLPEFTFAELEAIVSEAHRLGKRVGAHAYGGLAVDQALDVGVDIIDHGGLVTESQLERMSSLGTYLVVTRGTALHSKRAVADGRSGQRDSSFSSSLDALIDGYRSVAKWAELHGVNVTVGSDCVHGGTAAEVCYLVEDGVPPQSALAAATARGADLLGQPALGRLEPGSAADIVFVEGDPLVDPHVLESVRGVLLDGRWVVPLSV